MGPSQEVPLMISQGEVLGDPSFWVPSTEPEGWEVWVGVEAVTEGWGG